MGKYNSEDTIRKNKSKIQFGQYKSKNANKKIQVGTIQFGKFKSEK